jgi:outer membrane receptor for ferrienterochelin and colicin
VFAEYRHTDENYANYSANYLFGARDVWNVGVRWKFSDTTQLTVGIDDVLNDADEWRMYPASGYSGPTRGVFHLGKLVFW